MTTAFLCAGASCGGSSDDAGGAGASAVVHDWQDRETTVTASGGNVSVT